MFTRPAAARALLFTALLAVAACGDPGEKSGSEVPDRSAARVRMAQALLAEGHVAESIEQLRKLPATAENSIGPLSQPDWFEPVVAQLVLRRNLAEADSFLTLTGPLADRSPRLQALSANLMVLQGDTERAIATWAAIHTDDPAMQIQVHHELATLYMLSERPDEAESQCREGLVLDPDGWQMRMLLAESLFRQGRSDEALVEVRKMAPGVARWQTEARIELHGFDRPERAVQLLSQANRAAPRNADVRLQLAQAHIAARQYPEARVLLEPLVNLPRPLPGTREALIEVYDAIGESEGARKLRQQLEAESDHDELTRFRVAGLQASMAGNLETALENFDQALAIDPDDADLHNDRGAMLARLQRYKEAEAAFRTAEELAPEDPVVQENLARLYHRTGDTGLRDAALTRWEELTGQQAPRPE